MEYLFVITEFPDDDANEPIVHKLSPVDAYTFLINEHTFLPKIAVISNNDFLVILFPSSNKNRIVYHDSVWNNFINLNHKIFKNAHYQFHHQIQTDGVSCSLLFIRKDLKDKKWGTRVPTIAEQNFYNIEDLSK